jgi:nucleoside-diphosphate-sugar epimerase
MFENRVVGVIGATSMVGQCILPLLSDAHCKIVAFSRQSNFPSTETLIWKSSNSLPESYIDAIPYWICLAPIWVISEYFETLNACGARHIIALSSTSRYTKSQSSDDSEKLLAQNIFEAEAKLQCWAEENQIAWTIMRPTLIYGLGQDKNITEIAGLIRRFGFFPLIGKAKGLRQPVHVKDVAWAVLSALSSPAAANKSYNLSGGETITYKAMVERIFISIGKTPLFLKIPIRLMQLTIMVLRCFPRYRQWKLAMAERMNQDLIFDHQEAMKDLGFNPRLFKLEPEDLV